MNYEEITDSKAFKLFLEFCSIPHASLKTQTMRTWIKEYAQKKKINIQEDSAGNLLLHKGSPKLCLQAHYDMVLVGNKVEPYIDNGYIYAKESSLGADNGAAVCAALTLFDEVNHLELLLTNDEEVGMIGANNLELQPQSSKMLNLDSEDINEIIVGCAGGVDVSFTYEHLPLLEIEERLNIYKITSKGFIGGHSGIDIHKGIPHAILSLIEFVKSFDDVYLLSLNGGEKRNSIPVFSEALVLSAEPIAPNEHFDVSPFVLEPPYRDLNRLIEFCTLPILQGVLKKDSENNVLLSSNIGIIKELGFQTFNIQVMARSNSTQDLQEWLKQVAKYAQGYGALMEQSNFYPAWEVNKQSSNLLRSTKEAFKKYNLNPHVTSIHAGLECGILKNKLNLDEILSIGPTIQSPHSKNERMELKSFVIFQKIIKDIVEQFS